MAEYEDLDEHWQMCDGTDPTVEPSGTLDECLDEETGRVLCQVCIDIGFAIDALAERRDREED